MNEIANSRAEKTESVNFGLSSNLGVIRLPKLLKIIGLSRSTVYLKINKKSKYYDSKFPEPIRLGEKAIGWILQDVIDYIESIKNGY